MSEPDPSEAFADPNFPSLGEVCADKHPEGSVICEKPKPCYAFHLATSWDAERGPSSVTWPNKDMPPKPEKTGNHSKAKAMAERGKEKTAKDDIWAGPDHRFYKKDGPVNSRIAAEAGGKAMKRGSQLWQTADYLEANVGSWLGGLTFNCAEVGGQDGTRRLRQLREDFGWPIQGRKKEGSTEWEYRLVPENELAPLAELVDAPDSSPGVATREGSTPSGGTSPVTVEP